VRGTELEDELIVGTEVDFLQVLALMQVPEMQAASVLGAEQNLRHQPVLHGIGRAPLARHQRVVAEMPKRVVSETLRPTIHLPAAEHVEAFGVHQEDAARRFAFRVAERRDINAVGPAMHRVRAAIARGLDDLFRLDHPRDGRLSGVGLDVDDVDA
jgi:hypothetical protein